MRFRFTLQAIRMECLDEQVREWGKDEMRMLGFGVTRKGHSYSTGFRVLGSYGKGDVRTAGVFPMTLFERELESDELEVLFYAWLVEEDGGGVRDSATELESEFRTRYLQQAASATDAGFPRDCIPFIAFYKTALPFHSRVEDAGTKGRNDEVYLPFEVLMRFAPEGPGGARFRKDVVLERERKLGRYRLTLRYEYRRVPDVVA